MDRLTKIDQERLKLTPLERAALPELKWPSDVQPYLEIEDMRFPRIDWNFVKSATKKINGVTMPAFAVYQIYGNGNICEIEIDTGTSLCVCQASTAVKHYHSGREMLLAYPTEVFNELKASLLNETKQETSSKLEQKAVDNAAALTNGSDYFVLIAAVSLFCAIATAIMEWTMLATVSTLLCIASGCMAGLMRLIRESTKVEAKQEIKKVVEADKRMIITLRHEFKGIIPQSTRNLLKKLDIAWHKMHGDDDRYGACMLSKEQKHLFLLEEAHSWTADVRVFEEPRNVDPLIVYMKDGVAYLIDAFDVSPLENFIAKEASFGSVHVDGR